MAGLDYEEIFDEIYSGHFPLIKRVKSELQTFGENIWSTGVS